MPTPSEQQDTIPALTLWQPWAWLIVEGVKEFETRGWATKYRGPLAIHAAARKPNRSELNLGIITALDERGHSGDLKSLPLGCVVCVVDMVDCWPVDVAAHRMTAERWVQECKYGNYTPGRYAWKLANVRKFPAIPAKGAQGLWRWTVPDGVAL